MSTQHQKDLLCDCCNPPTRLVEEGSLTWGRRLNELLPFIITGALFLAVLAPTILLIRLGITGQFPAVQSLPMALLTKAGLGLAGGALVGLCAGLFGAEGGILGGVILGVLLSLAFGGTFEAPFDPHQRWDIVITSCLGGAVISALGYLCFTVADKRVRPTA